MSQADLRIPHPADDIAKGDTPTGVRESSRNIALGGNGQKAVVSQTSFYMTPVLRPSK